MTSNQIMWLMHYGDGVSIAEIARQVCRRPYDVRRAIERIDRRIRRAAPVAFWSAPTASASSSS